MTDVRPKYLRTLDFLLSDTSLKIKTVSKSNEHIRRFFQLKTRQTTMDKKSDDRKSIVIAGGGSGGAAVAHALSKTLPAGYDLVLIDPRSNHILVPSTIRLPITNPENLEDKVLIPFKNIFYNNNGTFHQARVTSIHSSSQGGGSVTLDNGENIHYDVLVLATGSTWHDTFAFPANDKELRNKWASTRATIKASKHIVLAGGGAVGIELAGEIRSEYPVSF